MSDKLQNADKALVEPAKLTGYLLSSFQASLFAQYYA